MSDSEPEVVPTADGIGVIPATTPLDAPVTTRDSSAEVQDLRDGRRSFGHRGSGFGPVAVTSRCGTQSSTWLKPSKRAPSRMTPSYKERR